MAYYAIFQVIYDESLKETFVQVKALICIPFLNLVLSACSSFRRSIFSLNAKLISCVDMEQKEIQWLDYFLPFYASLLLNKKLLF